MRKKRPLGQNFLIDKNMAAEIIRLADIPPEGRVVEIGPGHGVLTDLLMDRAGSVLALEIDPKLCRELIRRFKGRDKFQLVEADAMKYDYSAAGPKFKVVSNLPYYAAMPIMKRLLTYGSHITDMTLMMQKEVVDRLVAQPGHKEYGSLTVFTQFHCRVERLLEVAKTCFSPVPKIDSSLFRLTPLSQPPVKVNNMKTFFHVVHAAFFHKRKMLKNNLRTLQKLYPLDFQKIEDAGINLSRRGETLSLEDFASISNLLATNHDGS